MPFFKPFFFIDWQVQEPIVLSVLKDQIVMRILQTLQKPFYSGTLIFTQTFMENQLLKTLY